MTKWASALDDLEKKGTGKKHLKWTKFASSRVVSVNPD